MRNVDLHEFARLFTAYTELRAQENRTVSISSVRGNIAHNSRTDTGGISARVYLNGSWGFASSPDLTEEAIRAVIKAASDNASFLDARERKGKGPLPKTGATSENVFQTTKPRLSQKELVEFVREIDNHIVRTYPNLASRVVNLSSLDMEKTLLTSDGSYSHSLIPRSFIQVAMTIVKDGKPVDLTSVYGGLGQFEDRLQSPSVIYEGIQTHYEHLVKKSEGVFADAGAKTCVLDAEMAGILAHEAIGHTTEADLVLGGSVAGPMLGKEAASPLVTLVDFANTALEKTCPMPVYVDDEGTKAEDAVIIEKGILKGYMHNKESAAHFGVAPTGNARAFQFSDEPLIRMRNTAILPGESKLADSTSEFMFGVTLGYEIKGGKLGRAIRDTTISGVAFDLLKTVTMVSDDMKWLCAGMCGKKQAIPVGMGGPALKCVVSIGGR